MQAPILIAWRVRLHQFARYAMSKCWVLSMIVWHQQAVVQANFWSPRQLLPLLPFVHDVCHIQEKVWDEDAGPNNKMISSRINLSKLLFIDSIGLCAGCRSLLCCKQILFSKLVMNACPLHYIIWWSLNVVGCVGADPNCITCPTSTTICTSCQVGLQVQGDGSCGGGSRRRATCLDGQFLKSANTCWNCLIPAALEIRTSKVI